MQPRASVAENCKTFIAGSIPAVASVSEQIATPVAWQRSIVLWDHPERGIVRAEVEEALNDLERIEATEVRRNVVYHIVIGSTEKGRLLAVVWIDHQLGRFPIHARQAGRRVARRYYR